MPRPRTFKPKYCHDRATNRAYVTLSGKRKYLGPPGSYGTQASRDEYDRLVGEWIAAGRVAPAATAEQPAGVTVSTVIAAFWTHAQQYYRHADGTPTTEVENIRHALRPLRRLYGATPAASFGPKSLKSLQQEMIRLGWTRSNINKNIGRVKLVFKWAVAAEMIPPSVHHGLSAVPGLKRGRTDAEEADPVKPVPDHVLEATLPHLGRHVRAMVDLQLLTAMRPGELVTMRTCDLNRAGKVWIYTPARHKTQHHGHTREIRIGPKAQAVLAPFLKLDLQAYIFSPAEAEAERLEKIHAARKTPIGYGNGPGSNRVAKPKRAPRQRYTVGSYRKAIVRACQRAFDMPAELRESEAKDFREADTPEKRKERRRLRAEWNAAHTWHPHQLRHNAATYLRRQYGIEAARLTLGHHTLATTAIYAEMDAAKAESIMAEVG